ncbi:YceH family protein [Opitutus terrae]|uniref:UPF0502 protein Oter_3715 n=1 Tax=Opitutus terrae (strain DSM 11246 / JCM 15787 / PB90-1) TaxID=452637 RepID=Y3715_OPITP|nr:YceH family protein [Opitutus terrae]B1ZXJ5.1 RecName: Full=UPF0502 protein Oter_3715 [Opitutus terrae PB90-1]ACB76990.1 protein of unknown function DUF480 [Opitutus terrae PB90-1]
MAESTTPEVVAYPAGDEPLPVLSEVEVRVLGALVEKQLTTPEYYPLTLNALVNACNQTSSRDPIVSYDEATVTRGLDGLRDKKLAYVFAGAESRVVKFGHKFAERFELGRAEVAVLCVLLLRGPQTPGELRSRTGRMHAFESLPDLEQTIAALAAKQPHPLVTRLPRQTGFKEVRVTHLLGGSVSVSSAEPAPEPPPVDRTMQLDQDVAALRQELAELREQFAAFRKQFE